METKTTRSFVGEWYVHWMVPHDPKRWMASDNPAVYVRMHVYAESSGNWLDARLESPREDWGMYGQYNPTTGVWEGRWWAAPIPNDSAPDNRWGYFKFTLTASGETFTGEWNNAGLHPNDWYSWDGYKVCDAHTCPKLIKGGKWPR
jgi:hypothetical protein